MQRKYDVSGVSGLGVVAVGVEFPDGRVVMRWIIPPSSTSFWDSLDEVIAIHGHQGSTVAVFIDDSSDLPQEIVDLMEDRLGETTPATRN